MGLEFKLDLPGGTVLQSGEELGKIFDVAIVGGGPAGLTAAVYALRKQLQVILISPDLGGQVLWTRGVENYMGYQYIEGPELAQKFSAQVRQFPLKLAQGESVTRLSQEPEGPFQVVTNTDRNLLARSVILATGKRSRPLSIPGEQDYMGRGVTLCAICDGPFFKAQPVLVVGGGNSAISAALDMLDLGCAVTVVNVADGWQADPVLMEQVQDRVTLLDAHQLTEIYGDKEKVTGVKIAPRDSGAERELKVSGVLIEVGLLPNTEAYHGFVALNGHNEVNTDCFSRTSRPGVFAAGDCTSVPEKQIIIAAGDGAKAALAAHRFLKHIPD